MICDYKEIVSFCLFKKENNFFNSILDAHDDRNMAKNHLGNLEHDCFYDKNLIKQILKAQSDLNIV